MKPRGINFDMDTAQPPAKAGVMVLLDRSGSMSNIAAQMEAAFAEFVAGQKAEPGNLWLSLHQFDGSGYDVTYDKRPIAEVGALGLKPRGSTPLWQSLHRFLTGARAVLDDQSDETERLLLVMITDGQNTDLSQYSPAVCKELLNGLETATSTATATAARASGASPCRWPGAGPLRSRGALEVSYVRPEVGEHGEAHGGQHRERYGYARRVSA